MLFLEFELEILEEEPVLEPLVDLRLESAELDQVISDGRLGDFVLNANGVSCNSKKAVKRKRLHFNV